MRTGVARLRDRIRELEALDIAAIRTGSDPAIEELQKRIEATVAQVFGPKSHEYSQMHGTWHLDDTHYYMFVDFGRGGYAGPSAHDIQEGVTRGRDRAIALLRGAADTLDENLRYAEGATAGERDLPEAAARSNDIFLVHGHDERAKAEVALFLERAGLPPIILHEQANRGQTLIEKFERHGKASGFAVVLLTPDDVGGQVGAPTEPRARQNVIAEMGWFAGRLGRERVCVLRKGAVVVPSDFHGVAYTDMDERGAWRNELARELREAGYNGDWAKALLG